MNPFPSIPHEAHSQQLGFLLDQLCQQSDISHAVVVSIDGLMVASDRELPREMADHLSAVTSGLTSLTHSNAELLRQGRVTEIVVGMTQGQMVVMAIDDMALLTALAEPWANMGDVAVAMGRLIEQSGEILAPERRALT